MKYTVKKLEPNTTLKSTVSKTGKTTVEITSGAGISFAVVDEAGNVAQTKNRLTGKPQYEIYKLRSTAQQVANEKNGKIVACGLGIS